MKESTLKILNQTAAATTAGLNRRRVMPRLLGTAGAGFALPGLATGHTTSGTSPNRRKRRVG
jgi:hypothetical protein